jgi:RNA polymerase sigma factor (sigma-70 family)
MSSDLRQRARDGDPGAFAEMFDQYARVVYNHAYRLTADWSAAEDVMSATFLEAWRLHRRLDVEGGSLLPWLLGIATNLARNARRSDRRFRRAVAALGRSEPVTADHADEVDHRIDESRRLLSALQALARLRRAEREVLILCVWEGLDYAAAAVALGVPVGTIRSRLSRARHKLRDLTIAEMVTEKRELATSAGQVRGNRIPADRLGQEGSR